MSKKDSGGASKVEGSTGKKENSENKKPESAAPADGDKSKPEQPVSEQPKASFAPEAVDTGLDGIAAVQDSDEEPDVVYEHETVGENERSSDFVPESPEFITKEVEGDRPPKADSSYILISEKEKEEIRLEAVKMAKEEAKKKAREKFMEDELRKARLVEDAKQGIVTEEPMVRHRVNLPPSSAFHLINGKQYFHGKVYTVPKSLADDMRRTEYCGHVQEDVRKGNNRNEYGLIQREGMAYGPVSQGGGVQKPGGVLRA